MLCQNCIGVLGMPLCGALCCPLLVVHFGIFAAAAGCKCGCILRLSLFSMVLFMPRKFIKRWLPDADTLRKTPGLKHLGTVLDDPHLFHLSRRSVAVAF